MTNETKKELKEMFSRTMQKCWEVGLVYGKSFEDSRKDIDLEYIKFEKFIDENFSPKKNLIADEKFDMFWKKYPRHIGKKDAVKSWNRLKMNDPLFEKIMHALEISLVQTQWREKQFIPHPATWLNGERWEDEVESVKSVPSDNKYAGIV